MKLHENPQLFADVIKSAAKLLDMPQEFVEKDYWICQILQRLSRHDKSQYVVWKGGTSLAKAYGLINRFSSDVDVAVLTETMSQNQQKKFIARIGHDTTVDLEETDMGNETIKNNRFRKTFHTYKSAISDVNNSLAFLGCFVIVEINTYGNPYPFERRMVKSFITEVFEQQGLQDTITSYDMAPFELNVLDKRRTMCEKVVSLLRFSFFDNPIEGLSSKIRHFYDLHFMSMDEDCREYLKNEFPSNLMELIAHDKAEFDRPPLWKDADLTTSVLFTSFDETWQKLASTYKSELGRLTYGSLPAPDEIASSISQLMEYVQNIVSESFE